MAGNTQAGGAFGYRAGIIRDAALTAGIGQFAVIQSVSTSLGIDVVPIDPLDEAQH